MPTGVNLFLFHGAVLSVQGWLKQLQLPGGQDQQGPAPAYAALSALCAYLKRMRADQELASGKQHVHAHQLASIAACYMCQRQLLQSLLRDIAMMHYSVNVHAVALEFALCCQHGQVMVVKREANTASVTVCVPCFCLSAWQ